MFLSNHLPLPKIVIYFNTSLCLSSHLDISNRTVTFYLVIFKGSFRKFGDTFATFRAERPLPDSDELSQNQVLTTSAFKV